MENLPEEVWKDIPNYEGYYQASTLGRIKSLKREVNGPRGITCIVRERIMKLKTCKRGYKHVQLQKENIQEHPSAHVLVAKTFLNYEFVPHEKIVDHIDSDPSNNNLKNLQIISPRENILKSKLCEGKRLTGARWENRRKHWFAIISIRGKRKYLGVFSSELEAHQAYLKAVSEIK